MSNKYLYILTAIITSVILTFSCTDNMIPIDLDDPELNLDTLTIKTINGGTYLSPPTMGNTKGLYFGETNGYNNLFSLIKFSAASLNGLVRNYSLLDTSVTIDSLVFTFTATDDTLLTNSEFELYYFPQGGDSVFSDTESSYLNINEAEIQNAVSIGKSSFTQATPDSTESILPLLKFKIENFADVINVFADSVDIQNRTFMLRNVDNIDGLVAIQSRESADYGIMNVYYRVDADTLHSIFGTLDDITIVEPRAITDLDKNSLSVGRAAGLKSILKFDFAGLPLDSTFMVIKSAELIMNSNADDTMDDFVINASVLSDSVSISDFWEIEKDEFSIEQTALLTGTLKNNQITMEIREYLQGVNTGSFDNFGLKLYGSSTGDSFHSANLIFDSINTENNPLLKIVYVKL